MNYRDRQGTDKSTEKQEKKERKKQNKKWGLEHKHYQQLEYNFKKSLCKTQNIRNDIKIEL